MDFKVGDIIEKTDVSKTVVPFTIYKSSLDKYRFFRRNAYIFWV